MLWVWPEQGVQHSEQLLEKNWNYLNADFKEAAMGLNPINLAVYWINLLSKDWHWSTWMSNLSETKFFNLVNVFQLSITDFLTAAFNVTAVFIIRLIILILYFPRLLLYTIVALVAGIVMRDIRKLSGGREYGYRFHYIKRWIKVSTGLVILAYLSVPEAIHPNWFLLPMVWMFSLSVLFLAATFKKYF